MPTVIVDGQPIDISPDERLNGIEIARRAGVDIPHYCWHPGLSVVASCRMCLVESGRKDPESGEINMLPKLVPACQTPATDGTVFVTDSPKITEARSMVEEDLLIRHPIDCPICDKAGECHLQDYHFQHGQPQRRADIKPFTSRRRTMGDTVTLFVDRCVMCTRCVRFTREVSGTSELMIVNRGAHEEIDVFPGFPLDNKMSGNVVDLCPVGALGDRDFLYSQRVWFMDSHPSVCAGCATGCSIHVDENQDQVYRLKPRENPSVNQWWMCDDGRYGFKYAHDSHRVTEPRHFVEDTHQNIEWSQVHQALHQRLQDAGRLVGVISPFLTVEEAYLMATYLRSVDPEAILVAGHIPSAGEDESFPNGFVIRSEKCPNRRGIEAVVAGLGGGLKTWDDLESIISNGDVGGIWLSGGYPQADWGDDSVAKLLANLSLVIIQDLFESPVWNVAHFQLPAATFVEKGGSFVNHNDHLQSFPWAIRPPAGVVPESHVFWRLLRRPGMFNAEEVMQEVARDLGYFSAATGPISATGVDLRINQLAGA